MTECIAMRPYRKIAYRQRTEDLPSERLLRAEAGIREIGKNCKMAVTRCMAPSGDHGSGTGPSMGVDPTGEMHDDQLQ
jgi:hypothetical protein